MSPPIDDSPSDAPEDPSSADSPDSPSDAPEDPSSADSPDSPSDETSETSTDGTSDATPDSTASPDDTVGSAPNGQDDRPSDPEPSNVWE